MDRKIVRLFLKIKSYSKRRKLASVAVLGLIISFLLCLPEPIFKTPYSTILNDRDGKLLAARIADDGQWRFPQVDSVPHKFEQSLLYFEDQYFYKHPGINPVSVFKALIQNIRAGEIVRGGSTITLQVIRLSRKGKPRNVYEKLIEFILALRLELRYSKEEILNIYASQAPFGSNVVGLETAAWRYYQRPSSLLSWGEAATLAVLPNAPSLIYPGKNHEKLLAKRNRLLDKLQDKGILDELSCDLAKLEPLPLKPKPLPQFSSHLLDLAIQDGYNGRRVVTTIDRSTQTTANRLLNKFHQNYLNNEIYNGAMLVIDVESKSVLAYVGNTQTSAEESGRFVDMIKAKRSSGSILKPLLYAWMLDDGELLPGSLVPDIPTQISGYSPDNFNEKFDGAVFANNALARSLNVPFVRLLQDYGLQKFHSKINNTCINTIKKPADHYGLSLILGGAEVRLWKVCQLYAGMSSSLTFFNENSSLYSSASYGSLQYVQRKNKRETTLLEYDLFQAGSLWSTFEALSEMDRPIEGTNWEQYQSSKKIAWKTGTSFGHKDAWAVGVTPKYVVGVWVGNADGEGRPGLTGAGYAAPLMFEMYKHLEKPGWWDTPYDDLVETAVCKLSGFKASRFCDNMDTTFIPLNGVRTVECPYHKKVHLDESRTYRVTGGCYSVDRMQHANWFVLPPTIEWYYKKNHPFYKSLPSYLEGCFPTDAKNLEIIYPEPNAQVFLPRDFDGEYQEVIFEVVHRIPGTSIYWYLDEQYMGTTLDEHQLSLFIDEGTHVLTVVSDYGEKLIRQFDMIDKD